MSREGEPAASVQEAAGARGRTGRRAPDRPRPLEWAILAGAMLLGLGGLVFALRALG